MGHSTFKTEGAGVENGVHDTVAVALAGFENEAYIVLEFSHLTRPNLQEPTDSKF